MEARIVPNTRRTLQGGLAPKSENIKHDASNTTAPPTAQLRANPGKQPVKLLMNHGSDLWQPPYINSYHSKRTSSISPATIELRLLFLSQAYIPCKKLQGPQYTLYIEPRCPSSLALLPRILTGAHIPPCRPCPNLFPIASGTCLVHRPFAGRRAVSRLLLGSANRLLQKHNGIHGVQMLGPGLSGIA